MYLPDAECESLETGGDGVGKFGQEEGPEAVLLGPAALDEQVERPLLRSASLGCLAGQISIPTKRVPIVCLTTLAERTGGGAK